MSAARGQTRRWRVAHVSATRPTERTPCAMQTGLNRNRPGRSHRACTSTIRARPPCSTWCCHAEPRRRVPADPETGAGGFRQAGNRSRDRL